MPSTMRHLTLVACLLVPLAGSPGRASAKDVTLVLSDPDGAAARVQAPVSLELNLQGQFGKDADPSRLRLVELGTADGKPGSPVPVQFVPSLDTTSSGRATRRLSDTLWFFVPPGAKGDRRFRLSMANRPAAPALVIKKDGSGRYYDVFEGKLPVLRYNFGSVPVPPGTPRHFAKGESYERGDYISPLYGPDGEALTDDYPKDHPHHRGVWWSWPVTRWKKEVFDIWAVVGVHARPVAMRRVQAGPVLAVLQPESVWKWRDREPIVREDVVIRAFRQAGSSRTVDVEVRLTALADGVAIGGRPHAGYGGFSLRAAPCKERKITAHTDPAGASPRRAWLDYSGIFAGGKGPAGVTIFEHVTNPDYPNPLQQYPACNCVMPAYPAQREVPLPKGKTLVLRHRLWIHPGGAVPARLTDVWNAYNRPPKVRVEE
jgi:hypothetical protein